MAERKAKTARTAKAKPARRTKKPVRKKAAPQMDPYEQTAAELGLPILTTETSPRAAKARADKSPVPVIISKGAKSHPLPAPIPLDAINSADPFDLTAEFQNSEPPASAVSSATSSTSDEPEPGEPLSDEQEERLADLPGAEATDRDDPDEADAVASLLPSISFHEKQVRSVLVEGFDWLAGRFDSTHWKLTENQADMLAGPTAQLLGGVWTKLAVMLPDAMVSTPGATALLFAATVVVGPKIAQQMAISRQRRQGTRPEQPRRAPGPVPVPAQPRSQAVGPIQPEAPIQPIGEV